ncbi:unnamed protein product [Arabidopsis halleri]
MFYNGCLTIVIQRAFREFVYSTRDRPIVRAKISTVASRSQSIFASFVGGIIGEASPYNKKKSYKGLDGAFATFQFLIPVAIAGGFKAYEIVIAEGKSSWCRDFCDMRSPEFDNFKLIEKAKKMGNVDLALFVMYDFYRHCVGLAVGSGVAYLLIGTNSGEAAEIEEEWMKKQQLLKRNEELLEKCMGYYGITSAKRPQSS